MSPKFIDDVSFQKEVTFFISQIVTLTPKCAEVALQTCAQEQRVATWLPAGHSPFDTRSQCLARGSWRSRRNNQLAPCFSKPASHETALPYYAEGVSVRRDSALRGYSEHRRRPRDLGFCRKPPTPRDFLTRT